jgi:hypothetical protein
VSRSDQERMELVAAGRAVGADLVVERDDLVAVLRAEDHHVAGVGLVDESLEGSDHER